MLPALPQAYYNSRIRYTLFLLLALLFVLAGAWLLLNLPTDRWIGWACVIFFGAGAVLFVKQLLDRAPRLTLTATGVTDRTLKIGEIKWVDIQVAYLQSIRGSQFLCLQLRNTDDYLGRLSATMRRLATTNKVLGFTPISLNLTGLAVKSQDLLATVQALSQAARTS